MLRSWSLNLLLQNPYEAEQDSLASDLSVCMTNLFANLDDWLFDLGSWNKLYFLLSGCLLATDDENFASYGSDEVEQNCRTFP